MSMTILGIALAMAAPIFVMGMVSRNDKAIHLAAIVMFVLALLTGSIQYFIIDAVAIGITWFVTGALFAQTGPDKSV